jgi:hypothetical protein
MNGLSGFPAGANAPGPCDQTKIQRIDKWLFHARFYRSRALAQRPLPLPAGSG